MSLTLTALALGVSASVVPGTPKGLETPVSSSPSAFFWGDYDGDGLADAFVVGQGPARLLLNLGDGRFADITDRSGLTLASAGSRAHMALWADYDGDGRLDLYLPARAGASHLLRQTADGSFEIATRHAGLPQDLSPSSAQWLDYDADGQPDLRVVNAGVERLFHNVGTGLLEEIDLGIEPRPFMPGAITVMDPAMDRTIQNSDSMPGLPGNAGISPTTSGATAPAGAGASEICAPALRDTATGQCLKASSVPTAGMLYPLGNEFFIDSSGYVGLSTLTPGAKLDVVGGDIRTSGQLISTAGSGAPLAVSSSTMVPNLNADRLDGFHASSFSMLGNSIGLGEIETDAVDGNALAANSVQSVHIFPNTINSLDISSGGVLSDEIGDGTIIDVDINSIAAIAGTKISPNFGTQTVLSTGTASASATKGISINGPTTGHLGVQGTVDFDGITGLNWNGQEIGVAGVSSGGSVSDNVGVAGYSNNIGVRGNGGIYGVQGLTTADTDAAVGVYGQTAGSNGAGSGVLGEVSTPGAVGVGVRGIAPFYGVQGETTDNGVGVLGLTNNSGVGVYGRGRDGVIGDSQLTSGSSTGVFGTSQSTSGWGVHGVANASTGGNYGVFGESNSTSGRGVRGEAHATTGTTYGVQGRVHSTSGWGIISYGSSGTTGQKSFIQPHPTDPAKEIRFFSLEGNESGTYFRGTDRIVNGIAIIEVPEEFRLVSIDERMTVQMTPIGAPALLWIETRDLNQIVVRSSQDVEFDYTVNGVRRGYEVVQVIAENKAFVPETLGTPYGTQYPDSYRDILVQSGILNPDYTPNEATAQLMGWSLSAVTSQQLQADEIPALTRARGRKLGHTRPGTIDMVDQD